MKVLRITNPLKDVRSWLLLSGVALLWMTAVLVVPGKARLPSCPFRAVTGIPCPFCGITTGSSWLVRGHWLRAWESNVLSPMLMTGALVLGVYVMIFRLAAGRALSWEAEIGTLRMFWLVILMLVLVSWGVNLFRAF